MKAVYARLHILLARDAPVGLVIRHGTAKSVCTLLWDRKQDEFVLGQWMRGRIDTETCDLSPDGSHFLYSAKKYSLFKSLKYVDTAGRVAWTVVSRTPYLKAVAYYPGRWGGGWFLNCHEYGVLGGSPDPEDRESPEVRQVVADRPEPSLYAARLARGGWRIEDLRARFANRIEFIRAAGTGWELHHVMSEGYRLSRGEVELDTKSWEWADVDGKRLVWAEQGCLWAGMLRPDGLKQTRLLHNFNGMTFERRAAPYPGGRPVVGPPGAPTPEPPKVRKKPRPPLRRKPNRTKIRLDEEGDDVGAH